MRVYWRLVVSPPSYLTDKSYRDIGDEIVNGYNHGVLEDGEYDVVYSSNKTDWIYFPNGVPKEDKYVSEERVNNSLHGDIY